MEGGATFTVSIESNRYFACVVHGFLTRVEARAIHAELDRLAAAHPHIDRVLYDGTNTSGFETGSAIVWIRWSATRPRPSRRIAIVTQIRTAIATAATLRVMLPRLHFAVFPRREPAVAYLLAENDGPRSAK